MARLSNQWHTHSSYVLDDEEFAELSAGDQEEATLNSELWLNNGVNLEMIKKKKKTRCLQVAEYWSYRPLLLDWKIGQSL